MRAAPAASGVNVLWLNPLAATVKTRKNVPIASTAYFRLSAPSWGAAVYFRLAATHAGTATATDPRSLVTTSAICFLLVHGVRCGVTRPRTSRRGFIRRRPPSFGLWLEFPVPHSTLP